MAADTDGDRPLRSSAIACQNDKLLPYACVFHHLGIPLQRKVYFGSIWFSAPENEDFMVAFRILDPHISVSP